MYFLLPFETALTWHGELEWGANTLNWIFYADWCYGLIYWMLQFEKIQRDSG